MLYQWKISDPFDRYFHGNVYIRKFRILSEKFQLLDVEELSLHAIEMDCMGRVNTPIIFPGD